MDFKKIEQSLEKILPRKYTKETLSRLLEIQPDGLDIEAINKSINIPVWDFLDRGGKRWRPILFLTIIEVLGKNPKEFVDLASVFEIIHNGTIIIDDIEDSSPTRRGKPSLHLIYGEDIAINAGNLLYFLPLKIIKNYQKILSKEQIMNIYQTYMDEMISLGLGQATDIAWHRGLMDSTTISKAQYLQMCAFKTGGLSRMASKIAAIAGGGDEKLVETFGELGESLGVVFQIQDDILNITESKLSEMKGLGEDITEGKISLPVIFALKNLPNAKRKKLLQILSSHSSDKNKIKEAINLIKEGRGVEDAKLTMDQIYQKTMTKLTEGLTEGDGKDKLLKLAKFLIERQV